MYTCDIKTNHQIHPYVYIIYIKYSKTTTGHTRQSPKHNVGDSCHIKWDYVYGFFYALHTSVNEIENMVKQSISIRVLYSVVFQKVFSNSNVCEHV